MPIDLEALKAELPPTPSALSAKGSGGGKNSVQDEEKSCRNSVSAPFSTLLHPSAPAPASAESAEECRNEVSASVSPVQDNKNPASTPQVQKVQKGVGLVSEGKRELVKSFSSKPIPLLLLEEGANLEEALNLLMAQGVVGVDLETTGLDPHRDRVRLVSFSLRGLAGYPEASLVVDLYRLPQALEVLRPLFEAEEGPILVGHNLKFDLAFLLAKGVYPQGRRLWDTGLVHQVLHALPRMPALKDLVPVDKALQVSDWDGELSQAQLEYAATDALVVLDLYHRQVREVREKGLGRVVEVEMRALPAVAWMEVMGVPFDPGVWEEEVAKAKGAEAQALERLRPWGEINWRSTQQALKALHAHGLEVPDTREDTLALHRDHPLVQALLEYREASKRVSAFGDRWLEHLNPITGRIHPSWKQIGAETGRMACSKPNLQQVPRDPIRKAFRAPRGRVLIKADYSQIELRLAAAIARDIIMAKAFREGKDLHNLTAQWVLGKEEVSREDRQLAKALNFGLLYGMGAEKLRRYALANYGISLTLEEAQRFREAFFRLYSGLRAWHRGVKEGEVEVRTLLGRRRVTDRYTEKLNTPVQGSGADGLKLALALMYERRQEVPGAFPVLAVHDELVVEAPVEEGEKAKAWVEGAMREAMEEVLATAPLRVPVEVEAGLYWDWGITPLSRE